MVNPTATQPSRSASRTLPVTAGAGSVSSCRTSWLFSFRISGISPANSAAPVSRNPSGAAWALQPASIANSKWYRGSYPGGLTAQLRAGPCSKPWSTGRIRHLPVPFSAPWFRMRARFVFTPALSALYQPRISRTRSVIFALPRYSLIVCPPTLTLPLEGGGMGGGESSWLPFNGLSSFPLDELLRQADIFLTADQERH